MSKRRSRNQNCIEWGVHLVCLGLQQLYAGFRTSFLDVLISHSSQQCYQESKNAKHAYHSCKNFKQWVWTSHFINVYCMCTTITRCGFWGSEKFLVIQTTLQYKLQLLDRFSLFHRLSSHRKKEKPIITTITLVLLVLWHPNKVQWKENHKILTALHYKLLYNINRSEPRLIMAHVRCRVYFEFLFRINSL
jgi:hypothetical protein